MKRALKIFEVLTWIIILLLVGVTFDVSFNDGALSRRYLPGEFVEKLYEFREETRFLTGINDPVTKNFERYLNDPEERGILLNLSRSLKGKNQIESAWKILEWEDKRLTYDYGRAEPQFIPPSEFLSKGKGICGDYSLLTAGLLIAMNYSPVYVLAISFNDSETGHLTAAIRVGGKYLVADQHPPLMDLGTYYRHWAVYTANSSAKPLHIDRIEVYAVYWKDGRVNVRREGSMGRSEFMREDYNMTEGDARKLVGDLTSEIQRRFPNLKQDPLLLGSEKRDSPPEGYRSVSIFQATFPAYADYYIPEAHKGFVSLILDTLLENEELGRALETSDSFWVNGTLRKPSLSITVYTGRRGS
ncbi:hypothetical protein A3L09_01230 [Thermococcus profundus]|uniref:Transglutaminase-like domain-containing protein n=1 Tax=Thermococcus profundus TaxID=49899 RepID=A0A2Z2M6K2_THEPR|nr:transglutaminase-like domain-containing protein [Thermococcus profundus]ASJ01980.1 hypothetical protein A3L09_01230 [Thermococcus profundus]